MKVYQIISSFQPLIGGAERATCTLCEELISIGVQPEVLTTWYPGLERYEVIQAVPVRRMGLGARGKLRSLTFGLHTAYWVVRHGRSIPIIHTQNIDTPLLVGMLLKLLARKRWVATIHGGWHIPSMRHSQLGRLRLCMMRRLVDHFVAISEESGQAMLEVGVASERIASIPNGLDVDFFRPAQPEERDALRAQYGYGSDDVVLLFLGRLIYSKRPDLLLRAFAALETKTTVRCIFVGDGPELNNLRELARSLGVEAGVQFIGVVDNVRDYYWLSDVFVLPSRFEGLPVALLESMACGMAVLVSRCAGCTAAVADGISGFVCPIDDLEELLHQLKRLVDDAHLRQALGIEARHTAVTQFGIRAVAEAHLKLYNSLAGVPTELG